MYSSIIYIIYSMPYYTVAVPCMLHVIVHNRVRGNSHILHEDSTAPHACGLDTMEIIIICTKIIVWHIRRVDCGSRVQ